MILDDKALYFGGQWRYLYARKGIFCILLQLNLNRCHNGGGDLNWFQFKSLNSLWL